MSTLPYRTILRLPAESDAVRIAEQEAETWLLPRAAHDSRDLIRSGEVFSQGVHQIAPDAQVTVVRSERPEDGSRRIRIQLVEDTGWEVSITAVDYAAGNRRRDALVITAAKPVDPRGDWEAAPPALVRSLLARQGIFDGATRVTSEPQLIGPEELEGLIAAITDRTRSVSVIVAGSLGRDTDEAFGKRLKKLTSQTVGVAAVYLAREDTLAALNERLGSAHGVQPGRVRTYLPLVELGDELDGKRHRVLGPETFARAIRGNGVAWYLQSAFASETRTRLLARPLPTDIRRSLDVLDEAHKKLVHAHRIEVGVARRLASAVEAPTVDETEPSQLTDAREQTPEPVVRGQQGEGEVPVGRIFDRLRAIASRWLKLDGPVSESTVDELEQRLARESAQAEEWFDAATRLDDDLTAAKKELSDAEVERAELEFELSGADEEASRLRAKVRQLQNVLVDSHLYDRAYAVPEPELEWAAPPSVVELATVLRRESRNRHVAFSRVEFTGDLSDAGDVDKRDSAGRYPSAFWEFVRTLYDYAELKANGEFAGNVHMYLNSDVPGYKCSPHRHAAKESASVLSNSSWRAERVRPVPVSVAVEGVALMEAHFKPTHADTVAPRMHYLDDTDRSGKIYVGYIGRHLTNTKTRDS